VPLRDLFFQPARWPAEKPVKLFIRHRRAAQKIEIIQIQPERVVRLEIEQFVADGVGEFRFTIRREAHELVFAGIDAEAAVVSERQINEPKRMREAQLFLHLDFVARAVTDGRGRPFSHTAICH
jgi:hypothetical protein